MNEFRVRTSPDQLRVGNDIYRKNLINSKRFKMVLSWNVSNYSMANFVMFQRLLEKVRTFKQFNKEDDPYGEHDFGRIEHDGQTFYFKFDYFDGPDLMNGFDKESMTSDRCYRTMTIMEASEY